MKRSGLLVVLAVGLVMLGAGCWLLAKSFEEKELTHPSRVAALEPSFHVSSSEPQPTQAPPSNRADAVSQAERPASEDDYLRELAVLQTNNPSRALEWIERGDEWYPAQTGKAELRKAEARQASRITVLVDLDRMEEARGFARAFLAAHPESEYGGLVRGVTGIHPRPGKPAGL